MFSDLLQYYFFNLFKTNFKILNVFNKITENQGQCHLVEREDILPLNVG